MSPIETQKETGLEVKTYFKKIYSSYQKSVDKKNISNLYQRIRNEIEPSLKGRVLDIGSGGVTHYENQHIEYLISLDNVFEFLKSCKNKNVLNLNGDIKELPLRDRSFDCIIIQFVIHHLTDRSYEKNLKNVERSISECSRILKKGGMISIVDSMVPPLLEKLEIWNYQFFYQSLRILGKPMVFFFSIPHFHRILKEHHLRLEKAVHISWGKMKEVSQALFPWLRFPLDRSPVKCVFISATKI